MKRKDKIHLEHVQPIDNQLSAEIYNDYNENSQMTVEFLTIDEIKQRYGNQLTEKQIKELADSLFKQK
jgi:hypothetical protein